VLKHFSVQHLLFKGKFRFSTKADKGWSPSAYTALIGNLQGFPLAIPLAVHCPLRWLVVQDQVSSLSTKDKERQQAAQKVTLSWSWNNANNHKMALGKYKSWTLARDIGKHKRKFENEGKKVAIIEKQSLGQTNFNKQKICLLIFKCKCFCYFRSEIKSSIAYQYQLKRRPHYFNITILPSKYLKRNLLDLLSGFLTPIQIS